MRSVFEAQTDPRTNEELKMCFEEASQGVRQEVIGALIEGVAGAFTEAEKQIAVLIPEMARRKLI